MLNLASFANPETLLQILKVGRGRSGRGGRSGQQKQEEDSGYPVVSSCLIVYDAYSVWGNQ
jgi:hypothetical protein